MRGPHFVDLDMVAIHKIDIVDIRNMINIHYINIYKVFGQQVNIKFKVKAITLKSIFIQISDTNYNISRKPFPSSDNN